MYKFLSPKNKAEESSDLRHDYVWMFSNSYLG